MNPFVERHESNIAGVLECFDRVLLTGTLPEICHAEALSHYLSSREIRLFDYTQWAEPLHNELRAHAERLAAEAGLAIEFITNYRAFRKEERIKAILTKRGEHLGLVHIFSAMEACTAFRPWHDKATHTTRLKPTQGKCLHYYFYFIDERFGLCYVRLPTWAPFRLQVYFNGHRWLARQLERAGLSFSLADNAFMTLEDPKRTQIIADRFDTNIRPCIDDSTAGPSVSARSSSAFASATIGVSCRWSFPPMCSSIAKPSSNPSMPPSYAPPSMP